MPFTITEIKAYVSVDEGGEEGVCAMLGNDGMWLPMICADDRRLGLLRPLAEQLAKSTGKPIKVLRFSQREEVEVIQP